MVQAMMQGLQLGSLRIDPPLVLAPMAGVTDAAFRRLVKEVSAGCLGLLVTEFVAVEGLIRNVPRLVATMRPSPAEHPVAVQLHGKEPVRMAEAAQLAEQAGADLVDINAGCPVRNIVSKGGGAALMRDPERLAAIVAAVRRAVSCPVTVKIRAGWDEHSLNAVDIARRVVEAGADGLTVHGRTRSQLYTGRADWGVVRQVREAVPVPVVGNGDLTSPAQALARLAETGVAGLMVGRAALGNPWIFKQIVEFAQGVPPCVPTLAEKLGWWQRYGRELEQEGLPPRGVLGRMKQLAGPMTRGLVGGAALRRAIYSCGDVEEVHRLLQELADQDGEVPRPAGEPGE
jgi:nifR3 family TIM-barrel protein